MEEKNCLSCASLGTCEILGIFKDEDGRVPVQLLDVIGSDCKKYLNPGK